MTHQRQGRPQEPAAPTARRGVGAGAGARRRRPQDRGVRPRRGPRRGPGPRAVSVDSRLLRRPRRQLPADGAVLGAAAPERPGSRRCRCSDIYLHPTVAAARRACWARGVPPPDRRTGPRRRAGRRHGGSTCSVGTAQLLSLLAAAYVRRPRAGDGLLWVVAAPTVAVDSAARRCRSGQRRAPAWSCAADRRQVAAHRPLEGRRSSRSGASRYLRFWFVKTLIRSNPLVLFAGSPLYVVYLRALGARIGRAPPSSPARCRCAPTCSPSATAPSSARTRPSTATGPQAGAIQTGPVTPRLRRPRRGEDGARHRHRDGGRRPAGPRSSLHAGQPCRPASAGTDPPPRRPSVDYRARPPAPLRRLRRFIYSTAAAGQRCSCSSSRAACLLVIRSLRPVSLPRRRSAARAGQR